MNCKPCRTKDHSGCRGGTWCCCQHKEGEPGQWLSEEGKRLQRLTVTSIESEEDLGDIGG